MAAPAGYSFDEEAQEAFVAQLGLPQGGVDVRLVATVMDLQLGNRSWGPHGPALWARAKPGPFLFWGDKFRTILTLRSWSARITGGKYQQCSEQWKRLHVASQGSSATAGGGRKIEIHRYTDTPIPPSHAPIHRYTDPGGPRERIAAIHRYTDPGGPWERSAPDCGNTPIHRYTDPGGIGSERRGIAVIHRYTDTPIQGGPGSDRRRTAVIHRYTDTPIQGGPGSDRRRTAVIHRYTDPGGPWERSAQDCGNTPIHRYTDPGGIGSERRRIAVIHRYTDPGRPWERSAQECGNTPIHRYTNPDPKPRIRHGDLRNTLPGPRTLPSPCRYADQRDANCGHANEAAAKQVPICGYTDRPPPH